MIVTIKGWRRPDMLKQVLQSIEKAHNADEHKYIISIDNHEATKSESIQAVKGFKLKDNVKLYYQKTNLGCAGNMNFCFEKVFEETDESFMIHLEDDTIVAPDIFRWFEWSKDIVEKYNLFAAQPFTRVCAQEENIDEFNPATHYFRDHFECGGGWGMSRSQWNRIKDLGGMFGAVGNCNTDVPADKWKDTIHVGWKGSWAWPFNKYFRRGRLCITPKVSRTNNIGHERGLFNPNEKWHYDNVYDPNWIESDRFLNIDKMGIEYICPDYKPDLG